MHLRALAASLLVVAAFGCSDEPTVSADGSDPREPERAIDGDSRPVVFTSGSLEELHLWLMTESGGDPVQLTRDDGVQLGPVWSPDGTRIAFVAAGSLSDDFDLWVVDADGGRLRRLTDTDDVWEGVPTWSPDGHHLAFSHSVGGIDEGGDIRVIDVDEPDDEQVVVADRGDWPSWSPDGETILYSGDADGTTALFTVPSGGGEPTMLETDGPPGASEASWSPDGTQIAFIATSGDPNAEDVADWNEDVWVMDADGTHARKVVTTDGNDHWRPSWSPDGRHLVFTADGAEDEGEIARVDLTTGDVTVLTDNETHDMMPSWRPTD